MRIRSRIDDDRAAARAGAMHGVDELAFSVVLLDRDVTAELGAQLPEAVVDIAQRRRAIDAWLAHAEQVEVRSMDHGDGHAFRSVHARRFLSALRADLS